MTDNYETTRMGDDVNLGYSATDYFATVYNADEYEEELELLRRAPVMQEALEELEDFIEDHMITPDAEHIAQAIIDDGLGRA